MNNKPIILPIGSVTPKARELFAYLVTNVLQRNRQPTLYAIALFMHTDCDSVMRMLANLQHYGLIKYSIEDGLKIEILGGRTQLKYMGDVD